MCYEMKLNGLNRILLPITENIEFTTQVKIVYDLHVLIDRLMGDKLKLEQFSFIYKEIEFISKSNFHEELFFLRIKVLWKQEYQNISFFRHYAILLMF
jgi:hypothetical protein